MSNFEFYKRIRTSDKKPQKSFPKLHNLYNKIPDTEGCMANIEEEGGCNGWCCACQSPQLLYSEFLNLWNSVMRNWEVNEICDVIEESLNNYIMGATTKGCVFFDHDTKMCKVHKKRPYNCRIYGITPEEEFAPRLAKMKELYKDDPEAIIEDQCHLIKTVNDKKLTVKDTDDWWNELVKIKIDAGLDKDIINDDMGGSYRTPHDHVLLYSMPDFIMQKLQEVRFIDNYDEKKAIVKKYMDAVRRSMENEPGES